MPWTWHDGFGQYPNAGLEEGNYTNLVTGADRARLWPTEADAERDSVRANKAGVAQVTIEQVP